MKRKTTPIKSKDEVHDHPDNRIDQDFKGFPHGNATEKIRKPNKEEDEKTAGLDDKDGEKRFYGKGETDEQDSDGSANAFDDK